MIHVYMKYPKLLHNSILWRLIELENSINSHHFDAFTSY